MSKNPSPLHQKLFKGISAFESQIFWE